MRKQFLLAKINKSLLLAAFLLWATGLPGQTGVFGSVVTLGETPSDVVIDELRGFLYLVRSNANRVEVYDYVNKRLQNPIPVGNFPVSAAMSPDGATLYVTNATSTSVSVIRLADKAVISTLSLPVRPEGVAVGNDGRVLITTQGTGVNNALQTLLLYDPRQDAALQLTAIQSPATISTGNINQNVFFGRPVTPFPGRLLPTPDGNFIIGMVAINQQLNTAQTTMFVYEVASGTILRNRTVTGQSTVLAMSPDGARFMAGSSQYDFGTLNVRGIMNTANLPFTLTGAVGFPTGVNFGGSVFSPDGRTLYSAFNYTATATNQRPTANVLFIGSPNNLGVRLGIRLPESILGKMVITADGSQIFALSESGLLSLPVGSLFDYPILDPESTQVFLTSDPCNKGISRATLRVSNLGKGKLTFNLPGAITSALVAQVTSGLAPSTISFTMDPGRVNVNRRPGTNVYNGNNGGAVVINLSSLEAINIPNSIRVFMNYRLNDQRGLIFPVPTLANGINPARGLRDLILDEKRNRVYLSNSGYNRI
ncbi:MAG: YncE family protein, partial [Acidobacteriota bacterium]